QQAIAIQMAGKRQYSQLISLFSNWDKYTTTLETSQDALGKLQEQQDIFMESVPAKLQQVRTSWEGVYDSILDSDSIVTVADLISGLLEKVESFFDSIGGGLPMLQMLVSTLLQAFSGQIGQQFGIMATNMRILTQQHRELTAEQELLIQLGNIENDKVLNEMIEKHKQVLRYKDAMTKAQQDEYNAMLTKEAEQKSLLAMLKNELEVAEQLKQKWQIQPGYDPAELTGRIDEFQKFLKKTKAGEIDLTLNKPNSKNFEDIFEQIRTKYSEIIENQDFYTSLFPPEKQQQFLNDLNEVFNLIAEQTNQFDAQGNPIFDWISPDENQVQQAYSAIQKVFSSVLVGAQEGEQELQQIRTADTNDLQQKIKQQESTVDAHEQRFKLFVQRLKDQHLGQTMSQLAGAVGQAISGFNMLKNIGSIWSNDDLSKSEKMLQTIQNVAFTVPMLTNSLKGLTVVTKLFSKEQAKNTIESLKNLNIKLAQDGLSLKQQAKAILRLASEAAETAAVEAETGAEVGNTAAKVANTAATGAQILVTAAYTVVALALVATLVALGIGIYKCVQAQKEADEANQKALNIANELKTKYRDLIDSNKELLASFSGYDEVWKQWKEGTATVDELHDSVTSLLETLGMADDINVQTALINAEQNGNFDRLNHLIQEREQQLKQRILEAKEAVADLEKGVQQRELIAGGEKQYEIDYDAAQYIKE
ncbi:MAG: hypothetical protein II453_03635, partial [Alphaproteobacteria bacterium]|nr:hypothetical protein [Alphaproteobacteria bacterium]